MAGKPRTTGGISGTGGKNVAAEYKQNGLVQNTRIGNNIYANSPKPKTPWTPTFTNAPKPQITLPPKPKVTAKPTPKITIKPDVPTVDTSTATVKTPPKVTSKPKPKVTATPKPTPKVTVKPTPKPTPKPKKSGQRGVFGYTVTDNLRGK